MPLFRSGSAMHSILRSSSAPSPLLSHIRGAPGTAQQSSWLPFKRFSSTSTSSSSPPRRSRPARHIRNTVYALCFASIGYTVGNYFVLNYLGGVEVPGSAADTARLSVIRAAFEKLDVTKQLRKQAEEEKGVWEEWEPYTNFTEEEKQGRLTSGCLNGSRAVAFQRLFWSSEEKKAISIIHIGNGVTGWPGIVHGGLQAIILDEALGRAAIRVFPSHTGVTANLNLDYKKPMAQNRFYKVVVQVDKETYTDRKANVSGWIEDLDGNIYTKASALFVVPRTLKLRKLEEKF
ncbi:thioesterase [Ascosphaera apis ARSEF 7405]|uniref:Thioesterase n=1 Tax=Ascosphaera apis ARSEF 7405 TaxID=392613 RepID=A0A162IPI7_9EURO|nr:thioesterase [Ascosphaera apis ARSEF 7405]